MNFQEAKTCVNSDFTLPLNKYGMFTKSTATARQALVNLGYTLRKTITTSDETIYVYFRNTDIGSMTHLSGETLCKNWYKVVNKWAVENGYGNICIGSRLPAVRENGNWLPTSYGYWASECYSGSRFYYFYSNYSTTDVNSKRSYRNEKDFNSYRILPVIYII